MQIIESKHETEKDIHSLISEMGDNKKNFKKNKVHWDKAYRFCFYDFWVFDQIFIRKFQNKVLTNKKSH